MGEAKRRGAYEQRVMQANERGAVARAERERREAEAAAAEAKRVADMPPEQRERYKARKHSRYITTAMLIGTLAGIVALPPRRGNGKA